MKQEITPIDVVNKVATNHGWREAVKRFPQVCAPLRQEYPLQRAVDQSLADFRFLMPARLEGAALNVGSDWSTISLALAHTFNRVYALDTDGGLLQFGQIRSCQEGQNNVFPIYGRAHDIPLPADSVDLVTMADAFEWVPATMPLVEPATLQKKSLSEAYRVLKPGGTLHLAIENRYGYPYWLGARDLHTRLRFITILPRRIANLYSLAARGKRYRERIPSWGELKQLLIEARFEDIRLYYPLPGYRNFAWVASANSRKELQFAAGRIEGGQGLLTRLSARLSKKLVLFPRFSLFVKKGAR